MALRPNSAEMTVDFVAQAIGLNQLRLAPGGKSAVEFFSSVTTDSRKIQPGCLFVALPGEKFDGHDYIPAAIAQGARGVLHRKGVTVPPVPGVHFYAVEDTVAAYRKLGGAWRRQFSIPLAIVAGSVGKTTTKEILAALLRGRFKEVLKTQGSQNGFLGIPMTLLELRSHHGAAVVEIGIDDVGAMKQHLELAHAGFAVLTAIGPEHMENLQDLPTVAREEGLALSQTAAAGGFVAVHLDDPWIRPHFSSVKGNSKIGFTLEGYTVQGKPVISGTVSSDGATLTVTGPEMPEPEKFVLPLPGKHNASNFLAAFTLAIGMGLTIAEIRRGLATFQGAEGRSELKRFPNGSRAICDYYNASPPSMNAAFELLTNEATRSKPPAPRWACLGDMLELGKDEEKFHRDLAAKIVSHGIEHVLLYGTRMRWLQEELASRKFAGDLRHFESHDEISSVLNREFQAGGVILLKGSRSMKMETVWKSVEPRLAR